MATASGADDDLKIDAAEIKGQAGTEVLARDAIITYGDVRLRSSRILYDTQAGWIKASEGVQVTDGMGNVLETKLLDYFPQLGRAVAEGDVKFTAESGVSLWAHLIRFEIEAQGVFVEGGGRLRDRNGNVITASTMRYDLDERTGGATEVVLRSEEQRGAITANVLSFDAEGYMLTEAAFTSCEIDDPAWVLKADTIEMDTKNRVTARHATLRLFDVPVFYLPSMSFNLSKERRSGFLSPKFIFRSGGEVNVETPLYLNLAPNYDARVSPRFINERGIFTNVKGRWLFPAAGGTGGFSYIKDEVTESNRWAWNLDTRLTVAKGYMLDVKGDWISDDLFADDFYEGDVTAKRHYEQSVELSKDVGDASYGLGILHYRTVDDMDPGVTRPYDSLPTAWAQWRPEAGDFDLSIKGQYDMFERDDDPLEGYRFHTVATAGRTDWLGNGRVVSNAGFAGSVYEREDTYWAVPFATAQYRYPLEGDFVLGEGSYRQVVEPRLMVGVVGKTDYDGVPVYDTTRADVNASDIYSVNSFVGGDRFDDTNLVVYGVETRLWQRGSDREVLSARVAQRFRLEDSKVAVGAVKAPKSGPSNVIAEGAMHPTRETAFVARVEWDTTISSFEQVDVEAQHVASAGDTVAVRYARNIIDGSLRDEGQAGLRLVKNLPGNWQFASDVNYDLKDKEVNEVFSGLSYVSPCRCWGVDIFAEREAVVQGNRTTYFFQVSLEGLGGLGSDRLSRVITDIREPL